MVLSWQDRVSELDSEIAAIEPQTRGSDITPPALDQITTLKSKRNDLIPLYQLPNEILLRVLLMLRCLDSSSDDVRQFNSSEWTGIDIRWVRAMLISRRLREVALSSGVLWTFISLNNAGMQSNHKRWSDICIARAGQGTLDLFASLTRCDDSSTQQAVNLIPKCFRVHIAISAPWRQDVDEDYESEAQEARDVLNMLMMNVFNREQPHLRYIEIFNQTLDHITIGHDFLGGAPNFKLTYLLLENATFHRDLPHLPALRSLVLKYMQIDSACVMLRGLSHCITALTFLRLDYPIIAGNARETPEAVAEAVELIKGQAVLILPLLTTLYLRGDHFMIRRIIDVLPVPSKALLIEVVGPRMRDTYDYPSASSFQLIETLVEDFSETLYTKVVVYLRQEALQGFTGGRTMVVRKTIRLEQWRLIPKLELKSHDTNHTHSRKITLELPFFERKNAVVDLTPGFG